MPGFSHAVISSVCLSTSRAGHSTGPHTVNTKQRFLLIQVGYSLAFLLDFFIPTLTRHRRTQTHLFTQSFCGGRPVSWKMTVFFGPSHRRKSWWKPDHSKGKKRVPSSSGTQSSISQPSEESDHARPTSVCTVKNTVALARSCWRFVNCSAFSNPTHSAPMVPVVHYYLTKVVFFRHKIFRYVVRILNQARETIWRSCSPLQAVVVQITCIESFARAPWGT